MTITETEPTGTRLSFASREVTRAMGVFTAFADDHDLHTAGVKFSPRAGGDRVDGADGHHSPPLPKIEVTLGGATGEFLKWGTALRGDRVLLDRDLKARRLHLALHVDLGGYEWIVRVDTLLAAGPGEAIAAAAHWHRDDHDHAGTLACMGFQQLTRLVEQATAR